MDPNVSLLILCPCGEWLHVEYDPGERQTRDYPGIPPEWIVTNDDDGKHEPHISYEQVQERCYRIDSECYDNLPWWWE